MISKLHPWNSRLSRANHEITLPLLDVFEKNHPFLHVLAQSVVHHAHIHVPERLVLKPHLNILLHLCNLLFNCSISSSQVNWAFWKLSKETAVSCVSFKFITLQANLQCRIIWIKILVLTLLSLYIFEQINCVFEIAFLSLEKRTGNSLHSPLVSDYIIVEG